jgi:hypothetical protein
MASRQCGLPRCHGCWPCSPATSTGGHGLMRSWNRRTRCWNAFAPSGHRLTQPGHQHTPCGIGFIRCGHCSLPIGNRSPAFGNKYPALGNRISAMRERCGLQREPSSGGRERGCTCRERLPARAEPVAAQRERCPVPWEPCPVLRACLCRVPPWFSWLCASRHDGTPGERSGASTLYQHPGALAVCPAAALRHRDRTQALVSMSLRRGTPPPPH